MSTLQTALPRVRTLLTRVSRHRHRHDPGPRWQPQTVARRGPGAAWTAALTAGLLLAVLWLYSTSGLLAPLWGIIGLLGLWVVFALLAVRVHRRHGAWALLVPVTAVAAWFGALTLGEQLLGWTA